MVHPSQRGQALIELIGAVVVLMTFAFLYFNFSMKQNQLLEKDRFEQRGSR